MFPQTAHSSLVRTRGVFICVLAIHSWISKDVRLNPGPCPPSKALVPASEALLGVGAGSWSADFSSVLFSDMKFCGVF